MQKPWTNIPIYPENEPLLEIPQKFFRIVPHPYFKLGAPYEDSSSPWKLREGTIYRLKKAQDYLYEIDKRLKLAIYDAWRPISVQKFMVNHAIKTECINHGIDPISDQNTDLYSDILIKVERFWATPSTNPLTPPPHSTGGAIDLTLADQNGLINMGSQIDEIGDKAFPNYFSKVSNNSKELQSLKFDSNRKLLESVMTTAGFTQHPNEWWHFSFGDQMWAWLSKAPHAIYQAWLPSNKLKIN